MADQEYSWINSIAIILFIAFSGWWGLYLTAPPSPKPADAPRTAFSSERAFEHVEVIAEAPHMLGTTGHDSVQRYILDELKKLGLDPKVHQGISRSNVRGYRVANTENILARLKGTSSERTILLMAHYDSVPYAPGAADDASGVASILETIRAVKAGSPIQNDLLILLTDGEELGLMGARQFVNSNPAVDEVDLILNFEARGSSGTSIMFETNTGNAKLIPYFSRFTSHPVANSLTYSIYKILPNDTDFTVFKPYDIPGLNFAFIQGFLDYHTMQDNPENLSMASLQHHGENLLDNVRGFGNLNFDLSAESDLVYFNSPLGGLTYYPENWSLYLTGLTVLLFFLLLVIGSRRKWFSKTKMLLGLVGYLGLLLVSSLITWFGCELIWQYIFPQYQWLQHGETYAHRWYLWFFISLNLLISISFLRWIKLKVRTNNLLSAIYLVNITLLITLTILLPAASYLFLWPVSFGLIGWILTGDELMKDNLSRRSLAIITVSQFMLLFFFPFYIKFIQVALTTQMLAGSMLLFILMVGLLFPLVDYIIEGAPRLSYAIFAIVAVICFTGAALNSGYDEDQKKQNSLIYSSNLDSQQSYWLSVDRTTDEWTSHFLGSQPPDSTFQSFEIVSTDQVLYCPAPSLNTQMQAPIIENVNYQVYDRQRILTLHFNRPYPAVVTSIFFPNIQPIQNIRLGEEPLYNKLQPIEGQPVSFIGFTYFGDIYFAPALQLTLSAETEAPEIKFTFYHPELPDSLMQNFPKRAPYMMPKPRGFSNGTVWTKTVDLEDL